MSARRDALLFLCAALIPAAATGILGVRALRNEDAALSRESALEVQRAAEKLASDARRAIDAGETALSAFAQNSITNETEQLALFEQISAARPSFSASLVFGEDAKVLLPREDRAGAGAGAGAGDRAERSCAEATSQLSAKNRREFVSKIVRECEDARDAQGRWVWPVLALPLAQQNPDVPARLVAWVEDYRDRMRAEERTLLASDLETAEGFSVDQRTRLLAALQGSARSSLMSDAAVTAAARGEAALTALRVARAQPGIPVRFSGAGLVGAVVALRAGGFSGWVVTPETIAASLGTNGTQLRPPAGFTITSIAELPVRDERVPEGVAFIAEGLGFRVRFGNLERLHARTTRSERLLGVLIAAGVLLALFFSLVLYRRTRATQKTSELRTSFVAGVSHELRTPLASVRMLSELLAEGRVAPEERIEVAEALAREAKRMSETVDRFMAYARSERGTLLAEKKPVDLAEALERRVRAFRERHPEAKVELTALPAEVAIDLPQIEIVIDNLLENALKYAPLGQPYRVRLAKREGMITFSVGDAGPGIPRPIARKIFNAFQRGDDRLSKATSGTGLGLFLVRAIARAHGGDVELEQDGRGGALFRVRLPA